MLNGQLPKRRQRSFPVSKFRPVLPLHLIIGTALLVSAPFNSSSLNAQAGKDYKLFIYYDERYPNAWFGKDDSGALVKYMVGVLNKLHIDYAITNADELRKVTLNEDPSRSILVFSQDVVPDTVWDGSPSSPIVRWLRDGAKIIWTGEWEFYYIGYRNGTLLHMQGIEYKPFGKPVTVAIDANVSAAQLGTRYIPSLEEFLTLRPFSEDLLQGFDYEVYGHAYVKGVRMIDPGLLKVDNGSFLKVGATGYQLEAVDRALYITELLLNRYFGFAMDLTKGLTNFHPYDSGIVYILPHGASTPHWSGVYSDRIYFYAFSNITQYEKHILSDLDAITKRYRFMILILPLEDTALFYHNLKRMDAWAAEKKTKILYSFFPKWKYGPEEDYLRTGSTKHDLMIYNMKFLSNLTSTLAIAIWYGWTHRPMNINEIKNFYDSLPDQLKEKYYVWIDEPFVEGAVRAGLTELASKLDLTVVTELYSPVKLALYGASFRRQVIVTGYWDAKTSDEWTISMKKKLNYVLVPIDDDFQYGKLGIWIFWDENDGSNEKYRAYINGTLHSPLLTSLPPLILMDRTRPIEARVDIGSSQVVGLHFSWPEGFSASNVEVILNSTSYTTDENGWVNFETSSETVARQIWIPIGARWGPYSLEVEMKTGPPSITWDMVMIDLEVERPRVNIEEEAWVKASGFYACDNQPFMGSYSLNDTLRKAAVGRYGYRVSRINDEKHGLTTFTTNEVYVVFDRIRVVEGGALGSRIDAGSSTIVWFKAIYEYDDAIFDLNKGVLYINGSAASWNELEKRWEVPTAIYEDPSKTSYMVTGVHDEVHRITVINDVVGPVSVEWIEVTALVGGLPMKVLLDIILTMTGAALVVIFVLWKRGKIFQKRD